MFLVNKQNPEATVYEGNFYKKGEPLPDGVETNSKGNDVVYNDQGIGAPAMDGHFIYRGPGQEGYNQGSPAMYQGFLNQGYELVETLPMPETAEEEPTDADKNTAEAPRD